MLVLPGVAADRAGPASLLAWLFDGALGVPVALTFAALASRFPDAGGVSVFAARAFGGAAGAVVGWFYFFAAAMIWSRRISVSGKFSTGSVPTVPGETSPPSRCTRARSARCG